MSLNYDALFNHPSTDEMLLNNLLQSWRVAFGVPGPLGIDDRNGTALANTQAIGLRTQNATLFTQSKLFESPFEIVPSHHRALAFTALWLGLITTQEDMPPRCTDPDILGQFLL